MTITAAVVRPAARATTVFMQPARRAADTIPVRQHTGPSCGLGQNPKLLDRVDGRPQRVAAIHAIDVRDAIHRPANPYP